MFYEGLPNTALHRLSQTVHEASLNGIPRCNYLCMLYILTEIFQYLKDKGYFKQHFERSVGDKFNSEYLTSAVHVKHGQAKVTSYRVIFRKIWF